MQIHVCIYESKENSNVHKFLRKHISKRVEKGIDENMMEMLDGMKHKWNQLTEKVFDVENKRCEKVTPEME